MRKIILIIFILSTHRVFSQSVSTIDSLYQIISTSTNDSITAFTHSGIGKQLENIGSYKEAIQHHLIALKIRKKIGDNLGIAASLNALGVVSRAQGDYSKAMKYYFKSLKVSEGIHDLSRQAMALSNIGVVYMRQKDFKKAREYFDKALAIDMSVKDVKGEAYDYGNIAILFTDINEIDSAIYYNQLSKSILSKIGDEPAMIQVYNTIGGLFLKNNKLDSARVYYNKGLEIAERLDLKEQQVLSNIQIAHSLWKDNQGDKAMGLCEKALGMAQELGNKRMVQSSCDCISIVAEVQGDIQKAYDYYIKVVDLDKEIFNKENDKTMARIEMQHEFEKKENEILAEKKKAAAIAEEKQKRQRTIIIAVVIGLILLSIFFFLLLKRYKITKEQKRLIELKERETQEQKLLLEEKNKEITDSITYAKRIQEAILPPKELIEQNLPNSFVLYKPKDIVAGDFYWLENIQKEPSLRGTKQSAEENEIASSESLRSHHRNDVVLFAAADCTGHGVPGAMVSVFCHNALNRAIREFNLTDPGKILDKTREIVVEQLNKPKSNELITMDTIRDGMDIALCFLNKKTCELKYAGANNPLWILRSGADEMEEIKATKQSIGQVDDPVEYETHTVQLGKGDHIYIFSDGLADQFGGEKGKKFKYKPFQQLLISVRNKTMDDQLIEMDDHFTKWKGNLEQVDDVCIIGVRI